MKMSYELLYRQDLFTSIELLDASDKEDNIFNDKERFLF
jgi:hypothetical protein